MTLDQTGPKSSEMFDFYIKLHWKGERSGALNVELEDSHVIQGRVVQSGEGQLEISIQSVPDAYMLSTFMPSLELAEIFGRNASSEAYELEHDMTLWMTLLISPVLKSYFNEGEPVQIQLP